VTAARRRLLRPFFVVFAAVTILIAGGVSYLASSSPDGLDSATLQGCEVVHTPAGEELRGQCIAQHAGDHAMASSPLADYAVGGRAGTGGLAGLAGVAVTVALAGGAFWLIARSRATPKPTAAGD
jgi:cobalt/nickel transport protein